jgi:hypothetical protein
MPKKALPIEKYCMIKDVRSCKYNTRKGVFLKNAEPMTVLVRSPVQGRKHLGDYKGKARFVTPQRKKDIK